MIIRVIAAIITGIVFVILVCILIPTVIVEAFFGSDKIYKWAMAKVSADIPNHPYNGYDGIDPETGRYTVSNAGLIYQDHPFYNTYTRAMYEKSLLPDFTFAKKFRIRKGYAWFQKGEPYPIYSFTYEVMIDFLEKGIIKPSIPIEHNSMSDKARRGVEGLENIQMPSKN